MKYKCCESILHYLVINPSVLYLCCSPQDNKVDFIKEYNGGNINLEYYKNFRKEYIENAKKGIFPEVCLSCNLLKEGDWQEETGLTSISIANRTKCSCNCIYCLACGEGNPDIKRKLNTFKPYDIVPLLKQLYENNLIEENCDIVIGGGECSEYPEDELKFFNDLTKKTNSKIYYYSSGFYFSQDIANALSNLKSQIKIAIDAGTADTYKKIKQADMFEQVWDNIKNYKHYADKNPNAEVIIKYIIVPGINDSENEAKLFIKKCLENNCKNIEITIEFYWFHKNHNKPMSENLKQTLKYFAALKDINIYFAISYADLWKKLNRNVNMEKLPVI